MNFNIQTVLAFFFMTSIAAAHEGIVRIPLKTFTKPASNLVASGGKKLSFADLARMNDSGSDLSKLQPIEDKYWQNKKYSAVDLAVHAEMPQAETGVTLDSYLGANRELGFYTIIVKPSSGKSERYGLTLGLQVHASLLKSALLRKLGYYQQSPKHYDKLKLSFSSKEEKELFVRRAFCEEGPDAVAIDCLSIAPFKTEEDKREFLSHAGEKSLYVHGAYLEKMDSEVPSLFDGLTPASVDSIPYFSSDRQFRALLVPFVIGDVQESLGRVSPESVLVRDGWAYINFAFSDYFSQTSGDDVKWMLRRVGQLSDQDWNEIIAAAEFPKSLNQIAKAAIMSRAQNMMNWFFDASESKSMMQARIPDFKYTSADGLVVDGRITQEYIPGEPHRFTHGERQSPFEKGDFLRYMLLKSQSSALGLAISKLSEKLKLDRQEITSSKLNGFRTNSQGKVLPVGYANGRQYGINFGASRIVTTGTFYGSQAAVQLVDNVRMSAGVGLFRAIEDISGISTILGGNVSYNRDFTHVIPLQTMKETKEIDWKDLYVPSRLDKIASPLKDGKLSEFFANFKNGEVFTITESIGGGAAVGYDYGVDALIGFVGQTTPSLGLSGGANAVILRQTQITKTDTGFQIFIRNQNTKAFQITFDVNYFINLLKVKHETTKTDLHTDAYILNANTDFIAQVDAAIAEVKKEALDRKEDPVAAVEAYFTENEELATRYKSQKAFADKMSGAIRALIFQSSTDQLAKNFRKQVFEIDHDINTKELKTKFLWWRKSKLKEEHLLKIFKPEVTAVTSGLVENKPIEVVTYRKGKMSGRDLLGFGLNVLDYGVSKLAPKYALSLSQESQNPSQMPFGRAQWHVVRTDTELTKREGSLPTVAVIQNVWGGWSLKKKDLDVILQKLRDKFSGPEFAGTDFQTKELIPDTRFNQVKKIDFFRITENLSLLPSAIEKIKQMLITPDATGVKLDKAQFLTRLFKKVNEDGTSKSARAEDKAIFKNLMTVIGGGDEAKGTAFYMEQCRARAEERQTNNTRGGGQVVVTTAWLKGSKYECLESWVDDIITLAREYVSSNAREQNRIMTELIYVLEENIPLPVLLKVLGKENYLYFVEITGFRKGDENADEAFSVSNVLGEPAKKHPYSNGLISIFADKTKIIPIELDRSQGSFQ